MNKKKPTYDELKEKLAKIEEFLARLQKSEINPIKSERDTAILSTKELAEAYLASEQNFKNSVDTFPLGIRIVTEDGDLIYANKAALSIFGYQTVEELAAVKRQELYTPESYAAHQERKKKRKLKQYVPGEYELSIRRPDGQVRNLQVFRREVMWGGEKQYMAMYEDITERKRAEEALRESEEKYHSLIEHSNDGIIFIQDGLINYCNSKMLEMGGYTTEDLYGKPFVDLIVPEQKENVTEIHKKGIAGLTVPERYELNLISKAGSIVNAEISSSLFYLRQKPVDIVIVRDITDRKKMDEAFRQSEEMFAKAFRSSPDAVMITTLDEGIVIDMNDAAVKNTGYSINELIGHSVYEFNLWANPEDREKMRNLLIKNNKVDKEEFKFRTKSGEIRTWEYSAEPIVIGGSNCIISVQRDITERKQAEEALSESEARFRALFETMAQGVVYQEASGKIMSANPAAERILGLTVDQILGRTSVDEHWKSAHEDGTDFPGEEHPSMVALRTGKPVENVVMGVFNPIFNERRWILINAIPEFKKGEKTPYRAYTTFTDITERKQAEEALKESEERYKTILNTALDGFWVVDNKYKILEVNDSYCKMTGYTREELLKMTIKDIEASESPDETDRHMKKIIREGSDRFETKHRRKDGHIIDVEASINYLDTEPGQVFVFFHNITSRKRAEEAIKESEERYRLLFENSKDAILLTSPDGGIQAANPEACRMFGRTEEEICRIGRSGILDTSDPRLESALEERRLTGEFSGELTGIRADGTKFPMELSSRLYSDREGKARTSMIIRDISERKQAEEALRASEERFRQIFQEGPLGIVLSNLDYHFTIMNDQYRNMFGYSEQEMRNMSFKDITFPEDIERDTLNLQKLVKGELNYYNREKRYIKKTKEVMWGSLTVTLLRDKSEKPLGFLAMVEDITERKRMEQALRESEEKFSKTFHTSPEAIAIVTAKDEKFIDINDSYTRITGYSREELIGNTITSFHIWATPEDHTKMLTMMQEKGRIYNEEFDYRTKSGEIRTRLFSLEPITINGEPCTIGVSIDITERKAAEEALKESEERFNTAFHASPNMMAVITLDEGRFIDINAEHTRITGYERREVIGKNTLELNLWVYPEKREEFYRIINTEGRLKDYEVLLRTKSGEIRTFLFSAEKITLRGINCIVVSALDITERKEAEERINHLNLTLRSIRNVSQMITREKDRSLLIQKICDSLVESQSFRSAWIVLLDEKRQPIIWAGANVNKEFPTLIELIKQNKMPHCVIKALKQKQVVVTENHEAMCKDCPINIGNIGTGSMTIRLEIEGKIYGVLYASIPKKLINDKEEIALFSEIATDIAFALRDIELVAANELREQERLRMVKMESIGMLAGGIAHDFNNLLTGIMGNIGLVKTYVSPSDPTYEMLDEAEVAAVRARDLTQQLLTFAKGGKPVKKLISPAEIIKESAEFALRGSKAKLELSFPDDLWPLEADEGQISQVINNIVINADEAMPAGGTLKITAENVALKKSDALPVRGGNYVRIDIKDTGIGISAAHVQRIFEPYFTTKQKGSGLGLTTAYSVVKNHGGIILLESVLNEGSTFHIYLPATKKALKGAKKLTVDESGQAGGKVLIMDDEEIIRKMLKNMLGMAGYTVELSADGAEALKKYEQAKEARDPFNAVIMDLTIPGGMGGKEAIKKLLEIDPKATVIVSSGYATDPIMSDYKRYGFKAVIAKPYSVKQLRDLLSRLLAKKKR